MKYLHLLIILILFYCNTGAAVDDEMIILSATKVSVPEKEVGGSVAVINREEIDNINAVTFVDLLRIVPGVAVSQSGPYGALTQVRIRGSEANHVLVLIDGVEANDPATGSEFNFANFLPESIERIEVLRGSQSSVWGSDALAGVINIVTRTGGDVVKLASSTEVGTHDYVRSSATVSGGAGDLKYFLQGSYIDTNGANISEQGSEKDGYDQASIIFNTQYEINPRLSFGLLLFYVYLLLIVIGIIN